jgi:hypothetical protein
LLLSPWLDTQATAVEEVLVERGIRHVRLDPQATGGQLEAYFDGSWRGEVAAYGSTVPVEEVTAVFFHSPKPHVPGSGARRQLQAGIEGVFESLDCRWMNHPSAVAAQNKATQLANAASCGLRTVQAMLATDRSLAVEFAVRVGNIDSEPVVARDDAQVYFRERLAAGVATIVFAVGKHIFGVRQDDNVSIDIPSAVRAGTQRYLVRSGLSFCALHFAVTADEWTFVRADPSEPWNAYATELGLPIAETIVDVLTQD